MKRGKSKISISIEKKLHLKKHFLQISVCTYCECKEKKHVSADEVLPSLTCSRSQRSHRGRQAAGSAESVWSGQQRSGKLRTVRVHSRRIQQPALSLQRQTHCSASQAERQLEKRDGRHTDGQKTEEASTETDGR